jgi:Ca-activated chloride channel homolog
MRPRHFPAAVFALGISALPSFAQQPTFRAGIDVVKVDVSIARGGEHVSGLKAENFEVFDNGVRQKITSVSPEQVPLEVYLVLDLSGSVEGEKLAELKRAAGAFVGGLVPRDKVALLTFTKTVTVRQELTDDIRAFKAALAEATSGGDTALYDAVAKALSLREPRDNRAIVVVFTDNHDNASSATSKQVVDAAERSDVTGYGVMPPEVQATGVGMAGPGFRSPQLQFQLGFLRSLADATGGRVFRASAHLPLEDLFDMVLDDARSRYVLTYSPDKPMPGWHKLSVKLVGAKGDVVARRGYFVGKPAGVQPPPTSAR